jgi:hypothetical protein
MDQRRLSVGDIVDDYCPRERRITDHAIVAMIDNAIRQTRCTACESEHPYKEARTPRSRRKTAPGALYAEVLANVAEPTPPRAAPQPEAAPEPPQAPPAAADAPGSDPPVREEGPVHRPLIRATLPRPDGTTPPQRPIPEFTIRQPGMRNRFREDGRFRGAHGGRSNGNHQAQGRGNRSGGNRPGGPGQGHGRPRHGRSSPHKKRSR